MDRRHLAFGVILSTLVMSPSLSATAQTGDPQAQASDPQAQASPPKSGTQPLPQAPSANVESRAFQGRAIPDVPLDLEPHPEVTLRRSPIHVATDLTHIVVSPIYLRKGDLKWLLPLTAVGAAAFATDTKMMTEEVSSNPSFNQTNINVSDGLRDGFIALPIAMLGMGQLRHEEWAKETGILSSEAMIDAYVVDEITKLCTFRERPLVDMGQGEFFIGKSGLNSSFVSGHSMVAWSSAAVIAGEYHGKWTRLLVYSAAAGVSATRVMGQQHFPTDVLVGGVGGWLIGHYVYRAHHHADVARKGD